MKAKNISFQMILLKYTHNLGKSLSNSIIVLGAREHHVAKNMIRVIPTLFFYFSVWVYHDQLFFGSRGKLMSCIEGKFKELHEMVKYDIVAKDVSMY